MTIQEFGLLYQLSIAKEYSSVHLFTSVHSYEGDLPGAKQKKDKENWKKNMDYWHKIEKLIKPQLTLLLTHKPKLALDNFFSANCLY